MMDSDWESFRVRRADRSRNRSVTFGVGSPRIRANRSHNSDSATCWGWPGVRWRAGRVEASLMLEWRPSSPDCGTPWMRWESSLCPKIVSFEQHHPLLLKMRPIDLLDTEEGATAVMRLIEGLESGAFS